MAEDADTPTEAEAGAPTNDDAPSDDVRSDDAPADDPQTGDPNLFGIDLGHRGAHADDTSRDEVDTPAPERVRATNRTLTERLASAAADRERDDDEPES